MRIELITTPNNHLKETGFGTKEACEGFVSSAAHQGISLRLTICESRDDLSGVLERGPDLVVLAVKYIPMSDQADIWLARFFEENGVNHTGSSDAALGFDSNKLLAKLTLAQTGVPSARFFTATPDEFTQESGIPLRYPVFLKPMDAANGNGIDEDSYATNFADFEHKVEELFELYSSPVLVEQYLGGSEYTVAILQTAHGSLVAPVEVIPPLPESGIRILGAEVKRNNSEALAKISNPDLKRKVCELAERAFDKLGASGFARIDIKTDYRGEPFFMEINMVPGMTMGSSYFPRAMEMERGLSYAAVVEAVIRSALRKSDVLLIHDCGPVSASEALHSRSPLPLK